VWIYLIALTAVCAIHALYFQAPLIDLYVSPHGPNAALLSALQRLHLPLVMELEVLIGALIGVGVVRLSQALERFKWARAINQDFAQLFAHASPTYLTAIAATSALTEEVIFRGWLQGHIGLMPTALIFGALHLPLERHHWPWTLSALLMGGVFGGLYEAFGSVTAPLIAHFTINHFNLHALARAGREAS
jgi:membrane protease YdiL (CAAX protease family)